MTGEEMLRRKLLRERDDRMMAVSTVRTFSKMKCVAALMAAGVWPQVKAWIEEAGLYDLYLAAQDFAEDNEYFLQGKAQIQAQLGWSDDQVEAILAASTAEG